MSSEKGQKHNIYFLLFFSSRQGSKIRKLPPILTFSLLRFDYDFQQGERFKVSKIFIRFFV